MSAKSSQAFSTPPNTGVRFVAWLFKALSRSLRLCVLSVAVYGLLNSPSPAAEPLEAELQCLALTIYHESRGEPDSGKLAVAYVVMNRVKDRRFPHTICDVVHQNTAADYRECEFSWACDTISDQPTNLTSWQDSVRIARSVYWGQALDPTGGAMWYHADYVEPKWAITLSEPQRLGRHLFYRAKDNTFTTLASTPERTRPAARQATVAGAMPDNRTPRLPEAIKSFLLELRMTMLICATDARDRAARINDAIYRQGDELAPGLILASITASAIVVRYQDRWFRFTL